MQTLGSGQHWSAIAHCADLLRVGNGSGGVDPVTHQFSQQGRAELGGDPSIAQRRADHFVEKQLPSFKIGRKESPDTEVTRRASAAASPVMFPAELVRGSVGTLTPLPASKSRKKSVFRAPPPLGQSHKKGTLAEKMCPSKAMTSQQVLLPGFGEAHRLPSCHSPLSRGFALEL